MPNQTEEITELYMRAHKYTHTHFNDATSPSVGVFEQSEALRLETCVWKNQKL